MFESSYNIWANILTYFSKSNEPMVTDSTQKKKKKKKESLKSALRFGRGYTVYST
jgi:hypothetical protein